MDSWSITAASWGGVSLERCATVSGAISTCIAFSTEDCCERDGRGVVLRRSEGRLLAVSLLVTLEEQEAMLSVEEEALI